MANALMESYKGRIALAEKYAAQTSGAKLDSYRKMNLAQCLGNVSKFMNENFSNIMPTQVADMGKWKKFCLSK